MTEQKIEEVLLEFKRQKTIPAKEFGQRFRREIPLLRGELYKRGILMHMIMEDGKFVYELRKLNRKTILEIMHKGVFDAQYIATRYGFRLHDLKEYCKKNGFILENVNHRRYRIVNGEPNNPVPCLQNIKYCVHFEQCYLSHKCAAARRAKERINKHKEKING